MTTTTVGSSESTKRPTESGQSDCLLKRGPEMDMWRTERHLRATFPTLHVETVCSDAFTASEAQNDWCLAAQKALALGAIAVLTGDRGVGKTIVACAIARNYCTCGHNLEDRKARYYRVADLFADQKAWFDRKHDGNGNRITEPLAKAREAGLLVLDEIHEKRDSEWEHSEIVRLIDWRYAEMRPTLMITNRRAGELAAVLGHSIVDRIKDRGVVVSCDGPNRRG